MSQSTGPILERIDQLEAELAKLRQQVASTLVQRVLPTNEAAIMECVTQGTHFGLFFDGVEEVLPVAKLVPLPEAEPWVLGTLNLRGQSVVVIDMGFRLLGKPHVIQPSEFIVTCNLHSSTSTQSPPERNGIDDLQNGRVGLLVDDVLDIDSVPPHALKHPGPGVAFAQYLMAVVHRGHGSLPIIEVGRVLGRPMSASSDSKD